VVKGRLKGHGGSGNGAKRIGVWFARMSGMLHILPAVRIADGGWGPTVGNGKRDDSKGDCGEKNLLT